MNSDWLDVLDGVVIGLTAMLGVLAIVLAAPTVIYYMFLGIYNFWSMVGVF